MDDLRLEWWSWFVVRWWLDWALAKFTFNSLEEEVDMILGDISDTKLLTEKNHLNVN